MTFSWPLQPSIVLVFRTQREDPVEDVISSRKHSLCRGVYLYMCPSVDRGIKKLEFISIILTKRDFQIWMLQQSVTGCSALFFNRMLFFISRPVSYSILLLTHHLTSLLHCLLHTGGNLKSLAQVLYGFMIGPCKTLATFSTWWVSR